MVTKANAEVDIPSCLGRGAKPSCEREWRQLLRWLWRRCEVLFDLIVSLLTLVIITDRSKGTWF